MTAKLIIIKKSRKKEGNLDLEYKLYKSEEIFESNPVSLFSISASVTNTESGEREEKLVSDITSDHEFAEELFSLIVRGKVTPLTLQDIIIDAID